jgi:medium-chain acyl-[acyl-carrier-protein] hydrolase
MAGAMPEPREPNPWLVRARPDPRAALRVFCYPYAGGGASVFRTWPDALPEDIEIVALEPPGRERRSREAPFDQLAPLVESLADGVAPLLDRPYVIYGHSLGALVGFALARELRRRGAPAPRQLVVSGQRAPQLRLCERIHERPDAELCAWLRDLGGIPEALLREPEIMAYFLPILRADMSVNADALDDEPPLACPIAALGGDADALVPGDALDAWRVHTAAGFEHEVFAGGHFFLQTARGPFLRSLARRLARWTAAS